MAQLSWQPNCETQVVVNVSSDRFRLCRQKLWLAKIESGLKLGGIFSDSKHVCSVG
jgi:hypothetical protein